VFFQHLDYMGVRRSGTDIITAINPRSQSQSFKLGTTIHIKMIHGQSSF
jgi:hypothetical protein